MTTRWGKIFALLSAVSLILAVIVLTIWFNSFSQKTTLLTVEWSGNSYSIVSDGGEFVLIGPPDDSQADPAARQMSLQMSNDDFEWQKGRGPFVEGIASPENPTGQLYEQFRTWRAERKIYLAPIREWLSALNDPKRFISAHMLLLCAAEEKWRQTAHGSATWREANFRRVPRLKRTTQPVTGEGVLVDTVIYLPADSSGTGPDLSVQQSLLQEWRGLLNVPRGEIFQGWVALGLLVVPLAWITQPHTQARKWRRWTFNAVATISLMIFLLSGVVWARSVQSDTQFMFEPRPAKSVAGLSDKFLSYRWIGFTGGRLKLLEMKVPESWKQVYEAVARGFQPIDGLQYQTAKASGFVGIGEKSLIIPGFEFYYLPAQNMIAQVPGYPRGVTMQMTYGVTFISIAWWMLMAMSALVPAIWASHEGVSWWIGRQQRRRGEVRCEVCGYDMSATPQRCPECGSEPVATEAGSAK